MRPSGEKPTTGPARRGRAGAAAERGRTPEQASSVAAGPRAAASPRPQEAGAAVAVPDDDALTRNSLTFPGAETGGHAEAAASPTGEARPDRLLVIACGALAREILALREINGWGHLDLVCLPAILHNHPDRIPEAVEEAILRHRDKARRIFVAYADCGTGGRLATIVRRHGVEMIEGPHCYSFFTGNEAFAARADGDVTTFYLTDFLARQFEAFVIRPLGLDRHPELRDAYFGHYRKLVYLAQTDDAALTERAREAAERLGLEFERRFTGFGDLATALERA